MGATATPLSTDQFLQSISASPLNYAGAADQQTTLQTGINPTFSKSIGIDEAISSIGNFALGALALEKLPANKVPVPSINTPTPVTSGATQVAKTLASGSVIFLLALLALVVLGIVYVMKKR